MKLIAKTLVGLRPVYDIEVEQVHNFYANGINVHNCATGGGVSVIKHNGTVVNSISIQSFVSLKFDQYKMFGSLNGNGLLYRTVVPTKDLQPSFSLSNFNISNAPDISRAVGYKVINNNRNLLRAHIAPLVQGMRVNESTEAASATFAITNTFNTGHLIGDIRRAYLADVDVGSVSGSTQLLATAADGNFSSDTGHWNASAGVSISGGTMNFTGVSTGGSLYLAGGYSGLPINTKVYLTYTISNYSSGTIRFSNQGFAVSTTVRSSNGTFTELFDTGSNGYLYISTNAILSIDDLVISPCVQDRSYKAQGASITGTLTKTQVAAAAQLVAYSGFSAANYLREPYSADLDFGTGEWSASAWVNVPVTLPVANFPVIGPELVTNGGFDTDTAWNKGTGWTISGGKAIHTGPAGYIVQTILTSGRTYRVTLTVDSVANGGFVQFPSVFFNPAATFLAGTHSVILTSNQSNLNTYSTSDAVLDNVSVVEVGAAIIFERAHSTGPRLRLGVDGIGRLVAEASDGTTTRTVTTTAAYNTATWIKPEAVYTTDGTLAIRVNGVEVAATRGTPLLTLNNASAVLTIGNSYALDAPFPGSIALLKLSATVPTAEQSQWMYEQEKQMFRAGAQVTLPDAGSIVDLAYDDATDKWLAVSATNESEWSGLVRTSATASPAGSYSKVSAASGIQLQARTTTNPGVDVTIPTYTIREELANRSLAAARLARNLVSFDYIGGFTANTTSGSTAIASAAGITYPVSYIGARVSATGIPADTFVAAVSGTTIYLTKAATATATGVQISFNDFILPVGYEAKDVLLAGVSQREGTTQAFTRLFDGFKETIRFTTAPSNTAFVQIQATRSIQ